MLGLHPVTRMAGMALTALDSDRVAAAAHAVVRGVHGPVELDELARAREDDWLADVVLALHERRGGDPAVALAWYEHLVERTPSEPGPLVALANMHYARGNNEEAIRLAEQAAGLVRSPTLLFNLAQIYARSFRMDEFEGAMAQAQGLDPGVVAKLSEVAPSGFVGDLPFSIAPIRSRMIDGAEGIAFVAPVSRAIMPGWLGRSWLYMAGAFALIAFLSLSFSERWERSSCCARCGTRVCNRCDGSVWNNEICNGCHHLFQRADTTDPAMRMARLAELRARETRVGTLALAASLLVPGVGGLLARRPDLSFLGLAFFVWGAALFLWRDGIVSDPLAVGAAGPLAFAIAGVVVLLGYAGVVTAGLLARRSL